MGNENKDLDITKLLAEAGAEVDALIKAEREKIEALQKNEKSAEASKEESSMQKKEEMKGNKANGQVMKKEESSKEESSMKKDEGSGYENQAPEASASADSSAPPAADPSAPPQPGAEEGQDLQSMVNSLDDEMLNELMQVVQMEMESRQSQQSPNPQEGSQSASGSMPPPPAPAAGPDMSKMAMAQKSELEETKNRLAKAEQEAQNMQKSFTAMTELLDKMVNRPVQKAVTDVRQIDYVDKGEGALKKAESENVSDEDLKKRATDMSKDFKKLATLNKSERETLSDFFVNKKRTPEILKLVSNK